jgi:hypothetical protein
MITLFGPNAFQRLKLLEKAGKTLKYIRDNYMTQIECNPYYKRPPYVPINEWENLKKDALERCSRHDEQIVSPKERRYVIILIMKLCTIYSLYLCDLTYFKHHTGCLTHQRKQKQENKSIGNTSSARVDIQNLLHEL